MSNAMTLFGGGQVPAHIASLAGQLGSNIPDRQTTPSLTYGGKTWTISKDGKKQPLMTRNAEGDEVPMSIIRVVILDANLRRGRAYYEGAYDPNNVSQPRCWSNDGEAPTEHVNEPFSDKCATCQWSAKGSKVNDRGDSVVACGQHRMLAVALPAALGVGALRLKIAITSDYDKESPDQNAAGWFSFQDYKNWLKSNNIDHTAQVVTKIKFDPNTDYPKLMFQAEKWVDASIADQIIELAGADDTKKLITDSWTPAGVDGVKTKPDADAHPLGAKPAAAKTTKPAAKPEPTVVEEEVVEEVVHQPARALVEDEGDGEMIIMGMDEPAPATKPAKAAASKPAAAKTKPAAAEATPQVSTDVSDDMAALLGQWGD